MSDEVLKPCPFCGGRGRVDGSSLSSLSWPAWKHKASCPMNAAKMYRNRKAALAAGNTRTPRPVSEEMVAELDEIAALFGDAVQADCESGVRVLNERAAAKYLAEYPATKAAIMEAQSRLGAILKALEG